MKLYTKRVHLRKFHYIYKITRSTGQFYVGLHSTDNLDDGYFGSGQILWKSIKKYGKEFHAKEILEYLPSRKELLIREREIVNEELLVNPLCMNLALGGGANCTNEQRAKWNLAKRQKPALTEEDRAKMRLERSLRKHSQETKTKMSEYGKGKVKSAEHLAKIAKARLQNMTAETRQKFSVNGGKHWYNNGAKSFLLLEQEASGLHRGRL